MTDATIDPFDQLRSELLRATTRDVTRTRKRAHVMRLATVTLAALLLLTGLAVAASDHVSTVLHGVSSSVLDVFHGSSTNNPSAVSVKLVQSMATSANALPMEPNGGPVMGVNGKVLLKRTINGTRVEITAFRRADSRGAAMTCYSVIVDGPRGGGQASCTNEFDPGLPIIFGRSVQSDGHAKRSFMAGITADDVVLVELRDTHGWHAAAMGDHAFWWEDRFAAAAPVMVRVTLTDGTTIERPLRAAN